jgi:hypothetical protein
MKALKILTIAVLSIAVIGCDEDDNISPNDCDTLVGNPWNLTLFSGGWQGLYEFQEGDVVWEFHEGDSLVVSVNDSLVMIPEISNFLQEGTYNYSVINEDSIWINYPFIWPSPGFDYAYSVTEGELIISDSPEVDGVEFTFSCD